LGWDAKRERGVEVQRVRVVERLEEPRGATRSHKLN
jgi:hypothetical protein